MKAKRKIPTSQELEINNVLRNSTPEEIMEYVENIRKQGKAEVSAGRSIIARGKGLLNKATFWEKFANNIVKSGSQQNKETVSLEEWLRPKKMLEKQKMCEKIHRSPASQIMKLSNQLWEEYLRSKNSNCLRSARIWKRLAIKRGAISTYEEDKMVKKAIVKAEPVVVKAKPTITKAEPKKVETKPVITKAEPAIVEPEPKKVIVKAKYEKVPFVVFRGKITDADEKLMSTTPKEPIPIRKVKLPFKIPNDGKEYSFDPETGTFTEKKVKYSSSMSQLYV